MKFKYYCVGISSLIKAKNNKYYSHLFFEMDNANLFHTWFKIRNFSDKYNIDFLLIKSSKKGIHLLSPEIFEIKTVIKLQKELKKLFKSDYYNLSVMLKTSGKKTLIKSFITHKRIKIMGNVLRLSDKPDKPVKVIKLFISKKKSGRKINDFILETYQPKGLTFLQYKLLKIRHKSIWYPNLISLYKTKKR